MCRRFAAWALAFLATPCTAFAAAPDPELAYAERALRESGVPTDGPGLLAYFRARTLSSADQERLRQTVRRLGDADFDVRAQASRALVAAGRAALPYLRPALGDGDLEVVRRARDCVHEIEQRPTSLQTSSAARLLADRRPVGAAEALLAFLPCADEEMIEEAVFAAIVQLGLTAGKPDPLLLTALDDRHPLRRAAAARAVGQAAAGERRSALRMLIDSDPRVRYEAAGALVRAGERSAVPTLLSLLTEAPPRFAWQAEDMLARLAGESAPAVPLGSGEPEQRQRSRAAWEVWWRTHGDKADLTRLQGEEPQLGLTLVCEYDGATGGRVWECGKDGKARWQVTGLQGPNDAQILPGGRILVAERNGARVTERDRQGKVLWQHQAPGSPIACQRLPNGNTLVTTFSELYEVAPDGRKVFTHSHSAGFRHAQRLKNGHIVYVSSNGQVVELDVAGKQLRSVSPAAYGQGAGYWASVEALPTGRFLLALGGANKVIEIDTAGKVMWESNLASAVHATRLRNGHTLVASFEGRILVELDRSGKEVGRIALQGRPFTVRRY